MASLSALIGARDSASDIARALLAPPSVSAGRGLAAYFEQATRAEAHLLLGDVEMSDRSLEQAIAAEPEDYSARSSTLRQFALLCGALGIDEGWLDRHRPPPALHYCGHMLRLPADAGALGALERAIGAALDRLRPGAVFGALAAGADLLIAKAALQRGADLHITLPFQESEFLRCSVAPWGEAWERQYRECRERATSFRIALPEPYLGDDTVFSTGAAYAMGLAIGHARSLCGRAIQLAAWDGAGRSGGAGTAADVATWRATGLPQEIVAFPPALREMSRPVMPRTTDASVRQSKAILFGDVRGFSKVEESRIPAFVDHVMGGMAQRLDRDGLRPELAATWGDGLHLVFPDASSAASAGLALQDEFRRLDLVAHDLPTHLALRLGGHVGPLTPMQDAFTGQPCYYGAHITIAARIEPVSMPGALFVSEPFAAQLALERALFRAEYVGQVELAKSFGAMRLFAILADRSPAQA